MSAPSSGTADGVVSNQEDDGTDHGNKKTIEVQARHTVRAKGIEKITAYHGPDDPQEDVKDDSFAALIDYLAADETRNQTQQNPSQD
jgi:hypothetical protein